VNSHGFLAREQFQSLLDQLQLAGYRCVGPQVRDGAMVYDDLDFVTQLPLGWHDEQAPGAYQLHQHSDSRYFAWANGPQALKPFTFAPRETLWRVERDAQGRLGFVENLPHVEPYAVIGVRSCDLAALKIQDKVFRESAYQDQYYSARRAALFTVVVNCSHPAATCFCVSTGDGPVAEVGYDLALTELDTGFIVAAGSEAGKKIFLQLTLSSVTDHQHYEAGEQRIQAERAQQRALPGRNLRDVLFANLEHPRWDEVAARCLSCGNCTQVCPTCFCHNESDDAKLDGADSQHVREWDSCFTAGHSALHGQVIRGETKLRYRQWLTHKLGSWHDQFGSSGCVGCGRCISWCPVGIDITEETAAICGGAA
jgi:ferredoxin